MTVDILSRLRDAVRRKRPPKMENKQLVSPSRQCCSRDFVAESNVTTLGNPAYSSDLTAAYSYLFSLKGRLFCDATDINKNATKELKRL